MKMMDKMSKPGMGKTVMHSKPASIFGGMTSVRMPVPPTAKIPVPKATCKVCPGANRMK